MIKIIDIDKLFDKYIGDYVYKNVGKVKPEEIENNIPKMYEKFGDEKLPELDGKTPNGYYGEFSAKELIDALKEHLVKGVAVSDFLCEGIMANKDSEKIMKEELEKELPEEFTLYLLNMLKDMGVSLPENRCLEFVLLDYPDSIVELATELLSEQADGVKESAITAYKTAEESRKVNLTEILSNASKDDRIFDILIAEFVKHQENIPLYASYLSKYGDERAIPFLITAIKDENINYADYEELRFAIESLGGSYDDKRDFTRDKFYKKIKGE